MTFWRLLFQDNLLGVKQDILFKIIALSVTRNPLCAVNKECHDHSMSSGLPSRVTSTGVSQEKLTEFATGGWACIWFVLVPQNTIVAGLCFWVVHSVCDVFVAVKMWNMVFWIVMPFGLTGATSISEEYIITVFRVKMRVGVRKFKLKMVCNDCAIVSHCSQHLCCHTDLKIYNSFIVKQLIVSCFWHKDLGELMYAFCMRFSDFLKTLWHGWFNGYLWAKNLNY